MSANNFTPGPWVIVRSCVGTVNSIEGADGCAVCYGDIRQSDARLISAAPDLLEALQLFVAWSEAERNHEGTTFWGRVEMLTALDASASAAIAKATGAQT